MNVFRKITLNSLKKNRTRTIVTLIGVILSAAMITAVATFIASLQNYMINNIIAVSGDWHVEFNNIDSVFIDELSQKSEVEVVAVSQYIGYAILEGGRNESKPYLFVSAFDDKAFAQMPIKLHAGRLPENDSEIVIPEHIESNGGVSYKVGDTVALTLGDRIREDESLGQGSPYDGRDINEDGTPAEQFVPRTTVAKTYTIVGICARPNFESYSAPGYTIITKIDVSSLSRSAGLNALIKLKKPNIVYEFADSTGSGSYTFNRDLLQYSGVSKNNSLNTTFYSLGGILIGLIMIGSILLIHNSFSISVSERTRQFGILSSVGATRKQLRKSVLFEGAVIGFLGIPLGVLAGIGGIGVTLSLTSSLFEDMASRSVAMVLSVSIPSIITAAVIGIITILISAYIPARKAAKLSAIDAIHQRTDIKIKAKKVKTPKLIQKLWGLEGNLALKNFKRNKKRYRSTVISLFVSVVLFISAGAFGMYLQNSAATTVNVSGYDIWFSSNSITEEKMLQLYEQLKNVSGVYHSGYYKYFYMEAQLPADRLTERYIRYRFGDTLGLDKTSISLAFFFIDDETYRNYGEELGLNPQVFGNGDINNMIAMAKINTYIQESGRYVYFDILQGDLPLFLSLSKKSELLEETEYRKEVAVSYLADKMPDIISDTHTNTMIIFAPFSLSEQFMPLARDHEMVFTFQSEDPNQSTNEMTAILKGMGMYSGYNLYNAAEMQQKNRNTILLINVFTYGFVVLISLITIANVFNTVSTNINLRRREFAMLKSVGMTNKGFNKMMNFECVFYGLKSLLYGLPVAFFITYLIYRSIGMGTDTSFVIPWLSVGISILSVFIVVFVTMIYSISKVKKENVVEALRNDVL